MIYSTSYPWSLRSSQNINWWRLAVTQQSTRFYQSTYPQAFFQKKHAAHWELRKARKNRPWAFRASPSIQAVHPTETIKTKNHGTSHHVDPPVAIFGATASLPDRAQLRWTLRCWTYCCAVSDSAGCLFGQLYIYKMAPALMVFSKEKVKHVVERFVVDISKRLPETSCN